MTADRAPSPLEENRVATIGIWPETMYRLLELPDGFHVERLFTRQDPLGIVLVVSSPDLDAQPPHTESPALEGSWFTEQLFAAGKLWTRWGWSPEGAPDPDATVVYLPPPVNDGTVDTDPVLLVQALQQHLEPLAEGDGPVAEAAGELVDALSDGLARMGRARLAESLQEREQAP